MPTISEIKKTLLNYDIWGQVRINRLFRESTDWLEFWNDIPSAAWLMKLAEAVELDDRSLLTASVACARAVLPIAGRNEVLKRWSEQSLDLCDKWISGIATERDVVLYAGQQRNQWFAISQNPGEFGKSSAIFAHRAAMRCVWFIHCSACRECSGADAATQEAIQALVHDGTERKVIETDLSPAYFSKPDPNMLLADEKLTHVVRKAIPFSKIHDLVASIEWIKGLR